MGCHKHEIKQLAIGKVIFQEGIKILFFFSVLMAVQVKVETIFNLGSIRSWAQMPKNPPSNPKQLLNQCLQQLSKQQAEEAIKSCRQAQVAFQATGDQLGEAQSTVNLGHAYKQIGQQEKALVSLKAGLSLAQQLGDNKGIAVARKHLGDVFTALEQPQKAKQLHVKAQQFFDLEIRANKFSKRGFEKYEANQIQESLKYWHKALTLYQEISDRKNEAISLNNLGIAYEVLKQYPEAMKYYRQSLDVYLEIGDNKGEAYSLYLLGELHSTSGHHNQAIGLFQQALAIQQNIDDHKGAAKTLERLGYSYEVLSQYPKAIGLLQQALAIQRNIHDYKGLSNSLFVLGKTFHNLGQHQEALKLFKLSLKFSQQKEYRFSEFRSLLGLGNIYKTLGENKKAIDFYEQSLSVERSLETKGATAIGSIGQVYLKLGQYKEAIRYFKKSLKIIQKESTRADEASVLSFLSSAYYFLGQYSQSIDLDQQVLAIRTEIGDREGQGKSLSSIGWTLKKMGQKELAIIFYKQSVNIRESIRIDNHVLSKDLQESYTQTVAVTYRRLADLLIAQGRIIEAQQVLELLKLQELNDFSKGTRSPDTLSKIGLNPSEQKIKAEHTTLIAFGRKFYNCEQSKCSSLKSLKKQYKAIDKAFFDLAREITQKVEANRTSQVAQGTQEFQANADRIVTAHPNSVLIYPLVLEDKVRLLWAAKGGVLADEVCNLPEANLNRTVTQFRELLGDPNSDLNQIKTLGKTLYDCLVKPLEPELQANGIEHLIFVPDRVTHYVPMGALYDGKQFLIQRYQISSVLSAELTNTDGRFPNTANDFSVLGLGLSEAKSGFNPLQHVLSEIDTLVKTNNDDLQGIYPGESFLNQDFNRAALENNVKGRQIIHIATHGEFLPANPYESYLLLGTGEKYPIYEIQSLRQLQGVDLVVLSACETAAGGQDHTGIEVAGISSYFLKGHKAKAVLASLWKVNDASTSQLMQLFYQKLATGKLSKTEALQQAQIALMTSKGSKEGDKRASVATVSTQRGIPPDIQQNWEHPYFWAPFILIGNGL